MRKDLNQKGYALLIVLFAIVIFLGLSGIFISSSLNHAKQEQSVDINNQAVVAAEMGLKKTSLDIKNQIDNKIEEITLKVMEQNAEIIACKDSLNCDLKILNYNINSLNVKEIANFEKFIANEMKGNIIDKYANELPLDEQIIMGDKKLYFKLSKYKLENDGKKIRITYDINGHSGSQLSKTITSTIEFEQLKSIYSVSNFVPVSIGNSSIPIDIFPGVTSESCSIFLNKNLENEDKPYNCKLFSNEKVESVVTTIINKNLYVKDFNVYVDNFESSICNGCSSSNLKDLFGLNLFVDGDVDLKNINKLKNVQLYIDGEFFAKNANNLGSSNSHSYFIARTFNIKNNNGITNTTIAVLGFEKNSNATFNYHNKFIIDDDSKFCIHLDRFTVQSKLNVSNIRGGGEVIYFAKEAYPFPEEPGGKNKKEIPTFTHLNNFTTFLDSCGIDSYSTNGNKIYVPIINENLPNSKVVNVLYN